MMIPICLMICIAKMSLALIKYDYYDLAAWAIITIGFINEYNKKN